MEFQQYYPTYKYTNRDVVLAEFEEAQKITNTQNKLYGQFANLFIALTTIGLTLLIKSSDASLSMIFTTVKKNIILFNIIFWIIASIILRYFIELQKTIVINCRKVVTLRHILGFDYGKLQLTIPNWRVEGATNPFVIKLFPGWLKFNCSPLWIVIIIINTFLYLSHEQLNQNYNNIYWLVIHIILSIIFILIYRIQLNETHETFYLILVKCLSWLFRIKLIKKFEYIIYRAKLAVHESNRLNYETYNLEKILVKIEDSKFYSHKGVDLKSLVRSILSISKKYRIKKGILRSGGSTITMQLCRTMFIPSNQHILFRKIIEILLSFWLEKQFSKKEILAFYLASVRFEKNVIGLISASKYFFLNKKKKKFSHEEAFFLIERLSNISSTYRIKKIKSLFNTISNDINLSLKTIIKLYKQKEKIKLIKKSN